ncbi:glycine dehydrogenase [Chitinophaga terrae (ex Kim and Jung 2007)]|uniref:Glycine dehydrogenase (decarboxylating) n=1 Tax=Chitinophaga terrae (ex Kim and Jung 2007) TaxID=408074 RepID=A0A1H4BMI8_9BACT|nr:aminomethyl-transferring glycine dehydrogenase [Chitinophaga terrae (ex Kim and Jung 2007)]MDQ0110452.1 glycine dehydrogenase [Chitinophaga terrae (ex Kim and Jung 2007)]GEP89661.1 glycine dehydrogenase (aminomethyl-transferring) [Chitinophaga terrae (ex Kim and Jung 2007)]SEA49351.1 glycine dehydrogenase [Chitinophaga terrae (ex Kim and Jung 2007)]
MIFTDEFAHRHIGPRPAEIQEMLKVIGIGSVDELIEKTVPANIRLDKPMNIEEGLTEYEYLKHLRGIAGKNKVFRSYIGLGYSNTIVPAVIQRNILENPGWYTAYTPYQAEISQGRLEAILNYQTVVMDLTAMPIANASLLDEATAAAEAMSMFYEMRSPAKKKSGANRFFISATCFPQVVDVLKTRSVPFNIELVIGNFNEVIIDDSYYGALLPYPDANGEVNDYSTFISQAKLHEVQICVSADLLSLALLSPPGEWGADCVVGNSQRFGVPLGYGGPHAAFFACRDVYKRNMPGRIIGVSVDKLGNPALRMALQTREQHIKRERATSNICTAQALLAIMAGMYAVYHGPNGIKSIAQRVHNYAYSLAAELIKLGYSIRSKLFFDTIVVEVDKANDIVKRAEDKGMNFRFVDSSHVAISLDETCSFNDLEDILSVFTLINGASEAKLLTSKLILNSDLCRTSEFLAHPVFNKYHSETEMMRYIKKLENKDLSLVHSMISLGSCTMKLNAAAELMPITWPEFADLHPFAPKHQAAGYLEIIRQLNQYLCEITGLAATSFQPNSGAQGEYTGLMVIRAYHSDNGNDNRKVALIPSSAHGTNPASAAMAGMKIVIVKCDENGNIDLEDLKLKAEVHRTDLSCLMVTYPSTHGVYEERIVEIINIIHQNGGLVYMDGANMNAQVGLTSPGKIGADVCHLNLHKTFAIPHGGGGPGMGPICVAKHLINYLPNHVSNNVEHTPGIHAVSSTPYGSSLILLISYGYIKLLGCNGLKAATEMAILNANYIQAKLKMHFPTLYVGKNGYCAHEMILDCQSFKKSANVEVGDIAKRLMDYGFHSPTVSFPVHDTLMVEPTESESKVELDRFCEAMISIKKEIDEIAAGQYSREENVIKNSPHPVTMVTDADWKYDYSREKAVFPLSWIRENKFWPSVAKIDNAYGDRNLICSCPPVESYIEKELTL